MQPQDWDEAEVFEMDPEEALEIGLVPGLTLKERTVKFHGYFFGLLDAYKNRCAKLEECLNGAPAAQPSPAQPGLALSPRPVPQQQKQAPWVRLPICLNLVVWSRAHQASCRHAAGNSHALCPSYAATATGCSLLPQNLNVCVPHCSHYSLQPQDQDMLAARQGSL